MFNFGEIFQPIMLLVQYSKPVFHELVIPQDNFKGSYNYIYICLHQLF